MVLLTAGFAALACTAGCGGLVIVDEAGTTTGGEGGGKVEDAGVAGGGSRTCPNDTPPPSSTQPTKPGCYENNGSGWIEVECSCELWIKNPTPVETRVSIDLTTAPGATEPTLNGPLDVEITFEDPDASWFAIWTKQASKGETFAVTRAGKKTAVRMGTSTVKLAPVTLSACRRRDGEATVSGLPTATLTAHADLRDGEGNAIVSAETTCSDTPPVTSAPPG
jgi:hypothetical protein